jgi:hypothetical protein
LGNCKGAIALIDWKCQIVENVRAGRIDLTNTLALTAINDSSNLLFRGALKNEKSKSLGNKKGNLEWCLINKSNKERYILNNGDIIALKFGDFIIVGVTEIIDEFGIKLKAGYDYLSIYRYGDVTATLLIEACEYDYSSYAM